MKHIKLILGLLIAGTYLFLLGHGVDNKAGVLALTLVSPDISRSHLSVFIDYLQKNMEFQESLIWI